MPDTPDASELSSTGQPEGPSVPKPTETKPPEQPLSPGVQRIIDGIRNGSQGAPREVLEDVAKGGVIIDMVKGTDGKWEARKPGDPENPTGTDANPQTSSESGNTQKPKDTWELEQARRQANQERNEFWVNFQQRGQVRPRARPKPSSERPSNWREAPPNFSAARPANPRDGWREAELRDQKKEAEKQQELQKLQTDGSRLAALVYTPEGQQQIAETRKMLAQIVDAVEQKTGSRDQQKKARIEALLRGEDMTDIEAEVYLKSVLDWSHLDTLDTSYARQNEIMRLLNQFHRTRRDIGRAILYLNSEVKPVGQRHLLLSRETLDRYGITTSEAQESFARGWEGVKAQSLQQSQGRPKP